jgi:hypothetical protein
MVIVNGVTLSDHANQVTIEDTRDSVDVTAYGATNKAVAKGLGDAKHHGRLLPGLRRRQGPRDPAAAHRLLLDRHGVEVRPTSGARSATNPAAVMQGLLMNYNMLSGGVGEASTISAQFVNGSQTGMTYPTS